MIRAKLILLITVVFISCGNKNNLPPGILKPDKMQAVLWDVIRADAFTTDFIKKDSSKNAVEENVKLQKIIFAQHKVSKKIFYESYDFYKTNTQLFKPIIDSLINKANRERNKSFNIYPDLRKSIMNE